MESHHARKINYEIIFFFFLLAFLTNGCSINSVPHLGDGIHKEKSQLECVIFRALFPVMTQAFLRLFIPRTHLHNAILGSRGDDIIVVRTPCDIEHGAFVSSN